MHFPRLHLHLYVLYNGYRRETDRRRDVTTKLNMARTITQAVLNWDERPAEDHPVVTFWAEMRRDALVPAYRNAREMLRERRDTGAVATPF